MEPNDQNTPIRNKKIRTITLIIIVLVVVIGYLTFVRKTEAPKSQTDLSSQALINSLSAGDETSLGANEIQSVSKSTSAKSNTSGLSPSQKGELLQSLSN